MLMIRSFFFNAAHLVIYEVGIISLRRETLVHHPSLSIPLFTVVSVYVPSHECGWSCIYVLALALRGIHFASALFFEWFLYARL